jgi:hypothetical protein
MQSAFFAVPARRDKWRRSGYAKMADCIRPTTVGLLGRLKNVGAIQLCFQSDGNSIAILPSHAGFLSDGRSSQSGRMSGVAEPQLSVRSAKARDLARRLARREHRSIADVVERALEAYEIREAGREPAAAFYARLANDYGTDLDLEVLIRENRKINPGPEL